MNQLGFLASTMNRRDIKLYVHEELADAVIEKTQELIDSISADADDIEIARRECRRVLKFLNQFAKGRPGKRVP